MRASRVSRFGFRRALTATVIATLVIVMTPAGHAFPSSGGSVPHASDVNVDGWVWPLAGFRLDRPFVAPAHRYGPGHRGVDLQAMGGLDVRAPAAGTVAFAGQVAGRGVLTIDHGDGLVTTLEPIQTPLLPGAAVARSEWVGIVGVGGHASPGSLHFGVRLHGEYVNPMLLLGEVPRAVLLPCC